MVWKSPLQMENIVKKLITEVFAGKFSHYYSNY